MPAIAETRFLHEVSDQRARIDQELSRELDRDALYQVSLEYDIQSLLVELDQRGVRPETFLPPTPDTTTEEGSDPR